MKKTDEAHRETDELLEEMEKKLKREYSKAVRETQNKLDDYMRRFETKDAQWQKWVADGKKTQKEYQQWRTGQIMIGKRWEEMRDTLAQDYHNANVIAHSVVNGYMPEVYALNHNYATFEVEQGSQLDTSYTLYDRQTVERLLREDPDLLPKPGKSMTGKIAANKDIAWQEGQIQSATLQGILQGESIPHMARRICTELGNTNYASAVRYARTATTGAECAGRLDAYKRAQSLGIDMMQTWVATLDNRTRHSHRDLDGETVGLNEEFSNGCAYPGDPSGPPEEVWNCRCTTIGQVKGFETDVTDMNLRHDSHLDDMTYEEWKADHEDRHQQAEHAYSTLDIVRPSRPRKTDFDSYDDYQEAVSRYRQDREAYRNALDNAVDEALEVGRFSDVAEFEEWARDRGVIIEDGVIEKIDPRSFNEVSTALDEMFTRFPEVKSFEFESFDGNVYTSSFRIGLTDDGLLSANGGFNFNPSRFGDYADGLRVGLEGQTDGYLVKGDGTFSSLVRHEYGHNVQSYIEMKMADKYHYHSDDWRKNYKTFDEYDAARTKYFEERHRYDDELRALAGLTGSSVYSETNTNELFAEGFAEWSSGGTTAFGKAFGEFIGRWY